MSGRGRPAALPPADHARPEPLVLDALVARHFDIEGRCRQFDFTTLPVAQPLQRSLAGLFAARCNPDRWTAHGSSQSAWHHLAAFTRFLAEQKRPPQDVDELTGALIDRWWMLTRTTPGGRASFRTVCSLLRDDPRLHGGSIADALSRRIPAEKSRTQSYSRAEFEQIKNAARRMLRAALLRIEENAGHLERWRSGAITPGSGQWVLGEVLDVLARTGELPGQAGPSGSRSLARRYRRALGGTAREVTWQRLFLSHTEATALGVLLMAQYGWNLSVINRAVAPRAAPDPGRDGHPTYRIPVEKRRRGGGRWHESENVTDHGADSPGRLVTQALAATRFARAIVEQVAPGTDRLVVWRSGHRRTREVCDPDRHQPVGSFNFGLNSDHGASWAREEGFAGSPFRRGRRTVTAVEGRGPLQHSQETHDRAYLLADKQVRDAATAVIAAGAEAAADRARKAVLVAELRETRDRDDAQTATADCADFDHSPYPAPGGGCAASFLTCLGCTNARIHTDHHPRLAHLHHALDNARSVLAPPRWQRDWGDPHARLEDLKEKLGPGRWQRALERVTDGDRELIHDLLTGDLDS